MTLATRETVQVDPGGVRGGVVLGVALATALVMALGVLLAWEIQRTSSAAAGAPHAGRFGAQPGEVSSIEMALFEPLRGGGARQALAARERARDDGARGARGETIPTAGTDRAPARDGASSDSPERRLHSYGWTDRESGRVHIPISRAMELYLAREAGGAEP